MGDQCIAVLDIGTTNIRASIYHQSGALLGIRKQFVVKIISDESGQVEIDPLLLFDQSVGILRNLFQEHQITTKKLLSLGISTHRNSFLLWDRYTGQPYCDLICWNDTRSTHIADQWNRSYTIRTVKTMVKAITAVWAPKRFKLLKDFKFKTVHTLIRLYWLLYVLKKISTKQLKNSLFGTLETWMVWKLTKGKTHITDLSSVSSTSMYDISSNDWNYDLLFIFRIPLSILPRIVKTHGDILAIVNEEFFGSPVKITALIADQQAASVGETKLTLGSGTFLDITTKDNFIPTIKHNFYPMIGWVNSTKYCYIFEGNIADTSIQILNFLQKECLDISKPEILTILTHKIDDKPDNYDLCVRARDTLEMIVFRFYHLWLKLTLIYDVKAISYIKANGGVSNSDYILQCISTLCQMPVHRMADIESTSIGTMLLARTSHGLSFNEYTWTFEKSFLPQNINIYNELLMRFNKLGLNI